MQIKCSNPRVILNPHFDDLYRKSKYIITPDGEYLINHSYYRVPVKKWHPCHLSITPDVVDDYRFVTADGEYYQMYVVVPCGKCVLCGDRRRKEWSFRCLCESKYSTSTPLFLTLTYEHEPLEGLVKKHVQDWLKRLRSKFDYDGIKHNIRYFVCGEYGTRTKRAHYHAIIYNFPWLDTWTQVDYYIRSTWKHGFVMVAPIKKGGTNYVAKYMRKDCLEIPDKNPPFYLSSRKNGGLGFQYCQEMMQFFRNNPSETTITATDPYTGTSMTVALPRYFKDKIFPSMCKLVDKEIRDLFKEMQLKYLSLCERFDTFLPFGNYEGMQETYERLLYKYSFLPVIPRQKYFDLAVNYSDAVDVFNRLVDCMYLLIINDVDIDNVLYLLDRLNRRNIYISMQEYDDINLDRLEEEINYDILRQKDREKF